jgi:hypothetical protein
MALSIAMFNLPSPGPSSINLQAGLFIVKTPYHSYPTINFFDSN